MQDKQWRLGRDDRFRIKCNEIDLILTAENSMAACIKALNNSPNKTIDPYFFTVIRNYGYGNIEETINTDKVLRKAGYKSC